MNDNNLVIVDGTFQKAGDKVLPVQSRGLMYGDGCFETLRSYSGRFLRLEMHLRRLAQGMRHLGMKVPELLKPRPFKLQLHELLDKNGLLNEDAVVRIQVWRKGERGYHTERESEAHFTVQAGGYSPARSADPVSLSIVDIRRIPDQSLPSCYKLSNGINYILASREAASKGADDALMLTIEGFVSETTIANIFWMQNGEVFTPSEECDLLPGITRAQVLEILSQSSEIKVLEGKFRPEDLMSAEAVWVCNSVRELVPVKRIDESSYPVNHSMFREIQNKFISWRDKKTVPLK